MPGKKGAVAFPPPLLARLRRAKREGGGNCASLPLPGINAGPSAGFTEQHHAVAMFRPRERLPKKKPNRSQVERQIGRLLGRNSRAAGLFDIKVSDVERGGADGFLKVTWTKKDAWREWANLSGGCYLLRTNLTDWTAKDLWKT